MASPLNTALFSLPTTNTSLKFLSFFVNLTLLGFFLDFLYRPSLNLHNDLIFTRVGAVYSDSVKIQVRYPSPEGDAIRLVWKQLSGGLSGLEETSDHEGWTDGPLVALSEDNDWVGISRLENLWASTEYQCTHFSLLGDKMPAHLTISVSIDRLAFTNGTLLSYPATPITFKTFPDPRIPGTRFKFIASSCIVSLLPHFPLIANN